MGADRAQINGGSVYDTEYSRYSMVDLVELREIRVFLVLAEELHFGRTAEQLGLTQSRVSQTCAASSTSWASSCSIAPAAACR